MRINNNIMAYNAHRQLKVNASAQEKSLEKLSSGYRINRPVTMQQVCPYPKK